MLGIKTLRVSALKLVLTFVICLFYRNYCFLLVMLFLHYRNFQKNRSGTCSGIRYQVSGIRCGRNLTCALRPAPCTLLFVHNRFFYFRYSLFNLRRFRGISPNLSSRITEKKRRPLRQPAYLTTSIPPLSSVYLYIFRHFLSKIAFLRPDTPKPPKILFPIPYPLTPNYLLAKREIICYNSKNYNEDALCEKLLKKLFA